MTPYRPAPQDLAAATFQAWGQLTKAWLDAAERWWLTIVEWAFDEREWTGVNQAKPYAKCDPATPLRGDFYRTDDKAKKLIPTSQVLIAPADDGPHVKGESVQLLVTIRPGGVVAVGGHKGAVVDASTGAPVTGLVFIDVTTPT